MQNKIVNRIAKLTLIGCCLIGISQANAVIDLDTQNVTISGLSSGGYMAAQFHYAHAEIISGVGIIAAGPYNCAQGSLQTAFAQCIAQAPENFAANIINPYLDEPQLIAPASALQNDKVWLLHGELDTRIVRGVSDGLFAQYSETLDSSNLAYVTDKKYAHVFPTDAFGETCEASNSLFIGNCDFDAAGELLFHILGKLNDRVNTENSLKKGKLMKIEQSDLADIDSTSLHNNGFLYVPNSCTEGVKCKLHISFHGCNQAIDNVDDTYAKHNGINRWAATNNMVVLYPQIKGSSVFPMNPQSCWDWWGYTDENYANKNGKQIKAIKQMIDNLSNFLNQPK